MTKMQLMLRKASNTLYVNGKFDFNQMHNYRMAVTEREVINGCLSIKKAKLYIPSTTYRLDTIQDFLIA